MPRQRPIPAGTPHLDVPANAISAFRGQYFFLSNFHPAPAPSLEHWLQATKTRDPDERLWVLAAPDAREARARGQLVTLIDDWDRLKDSVLRDLLAIKFAPGSDPARRLLATGERYLLEGNHWGDVHFGAMLGPDRRWYGRNSLGRLLMERRWLLRTLAFPLPLSELMDRIAGASTMLEQRGTAANARLRALR